MQIGALLRNVIGDGYGSDQRTIALKPGQIVRGTVLQLVQPNEGIVSVHGVPVRVTLEQPLPEGSTAHMQVVEGDDGQMIMRIAPQASTASPQTIRAFLQMYGWPNQSSLHPLVQMILQEGLTLSKADADKLYTLFSNKPKHIPSQQWNETLMTLVKRNLPLSGESALALRQVLFGSPMPTVLTEFERNVEAFRMRLQASDGQAVAGKGTNERISTLLMTTQQLIANLKQISARIVQTVPMTAFPTLQQHAASITVHPNVTSMLANESLETSNNVRSQALLSSVNAEVSNGSLHRTGSEIPVGMLSVRSSQQLIASVVQQMTMNGMPQMEQGTDRSIMSARMFGEQTLPRTVSESIGARSMVSPIDSLNHRTFGMHMAERSASLLQPSLATMAGVESQPTSLPAQEQRLLQNETMHDRLPQQNASMNRSEGNPIVQLLKLIGIDYESSLHRLMRQSNAFSPMNLPLEGALVRGETTDALASLKSTLLQLTQLDELPVSLREGAQQLLQHITGQQLMLTQDRQAMMTHMMLLIPIYNEDGEQTAAISIQSKRPKKGWIDANNCRLLFDLSMRTLGNTIIDVKIADKKVFLSILNDHALIDTLVQSSKPALIDALSSIGYEVLSIQTGAYPHTNTDADEGLNSNFDDSKRMWQTMSAYRGVDVRV